MDTLPVSPLRLSADVHLAVDKDLAIFLDLRRDRYHCAPAAAIVGLGLAGKARSAAAVCPGSPEQALIDALVDHKLIESAGCRAVSDCQGGSSGAIALYRFLSSCVWARSIVATKRLDRGMRRLCVLAAARRRTGPAAANLYHAFERLRPLYPRARVCLFDSLAFAHFLVLHGGAGSLVFGVRVRPFAAHCWVEDERGALNDAMGQASSFAPIYRLDL